MKVNKFFIFISGVAMASYIVMLSVFVYYMVFLIRIATFIQEPTPTRQDATYAPGEKLQYTSIVDHNTENVKVDVTRKLVNKEYGTVSLSSYSYLTKKATFQRTDGFTIPADTEEGDYNLIIIRKFELNKLRDVVIETKTIVHIKKK